jgi:hypothetical protein
MENGRRDVGGRFQAVSGVHRLADGPLAKPCPAVEAGRSCAEAFTTKRKRFLGYLLAAAAAPAVVRRAGGAAQTFS